MNKIIKSDDIDFIGVEIGALVKKCPDMTSDMLYALLSLRGDVSKSDFKEAMTHFYFLFKYLFF
jgi:exocyst complex component 3